MRNVPSPVVVVTMREMGANPNTKLNCYRGVTMSSFTSVSLSPPIVSFCLRLPSQTGRILEHNGSQFVVNILSQGMMQHSVHFASPQNQQDFSPFPHYIDPESNLPVFMNCVSSLVCETDRQLIIGDHQVFFGRVGRILLPGTSHQQVFSSSSPPSPSVDGFNEIGGGPLLYYQRSYRSIGDEVFMKAFEDTSLSFQQWTHRAHLRMAWNYLRQESLSVDRAFDMIKRGILKYNAANQHLLKNGYNETITLFFTNLMQLALQADQRLLVLKNSTDAASIPSPDDDFLSFLKRYPFFEQQKILYTFYSKGHLYSEEAMKR
jgi:flavin reductase (DIM6/NTAB) family NADH-FMN oxidoreductase RutF